MSDITFSANGKDLAAVLSRLAKTTSRKFTLPILSCARLQIAADGTMLADVSNLDQWHQAPLPVTVESGSPGSGFCVRLDLFTSLVARCNGEGAHMHYDTKKGAITVSSGGRKATVLTLPAAEFPEVLALPPREEWEKVPGAAIAQAILDVASAQSDDETRYALNGVYLSHDGCAVATDGRRLSMMRFADTAPGALSDVILPTASLSSLTELMERAAQCDLVVTDGGVAVAIGPETYWTKRIEGNYPNFRQVIPADAFRKIKISVSRESLKAAIAWVHMLSSGANSRTVKINCHESTMILKIGRAHV